MAMTHHPYELEVFGPAPGETRLQFSGDIDLATAPSLLDSILCAGLAYEPGHRIVVDLAGVTFIDSTGLAALVEADRWLTNQEQVLVVASPPHRVVRLLELTGLGEVLRIELHSEGGTAVD